MVNFLKPRNPTADPRSANAKAHNIPEGEPVFVEYFSKVVEIPDTFLSLDDPPHDAQPVTFRQIDWADTTLPEYAGRYAVVLDNVISPAECQELLRLAESSVDVDLMNAKGGGRDPWRPAMVAAGMGYEVLDSGYRNSDRLVWDCQEIVDRLWARCLQGEVGDTLRERLAVLDGDQQITGIIRKGKHWKVWDEKWRMVGLAKRMRFLKYGEGQFFKRESVPNSLSWSRRASSF